MKLVIYDANWALYSPLLNRYLQTRWSISCGTKDLAWLLKEVPDADAMLGLELPREARSAARKLRVFLFPGAGAIQREPDALPSGCHLCNVFEHETPIAEYVLMVMLMHATQVMRYSARFREGSWEGNGRMGGAVHDEIDMKKLGLVGFGHIGQAVAIKARSVGLRVQAIRKDPSADITPEQAESVDIIGGPEDLCCLFQQNDFIVITCPLTAETRGWIGSRELACLPSHSLLVNVARAEIIQEEALFQALEQRKFSAALDVWYHYPETGDEVADGSRFALQRLPNVIATPHLSAWTLPMVERRMRRIAENLDRLHRGQPLERVIMTGTWTPTLELTNAATDT